MPLLLESSPDSVQYILSFFGMYPYVLCPMLHLYFYTRSIYSILSYCWYTLFTPLPPPPWPGYRCLTHLWSLAYNRYSPFVKVNRKSIEATDVEDI